MQSLPVLLLLREQCLLGPSPYVRVKNNNRTIIPLEIHKNEHVKATDLSMNGVKMPLTHCNKK